MKLSLFLAPLALFISPLNGAEAPEPVHIESQKLSPSLQELTSPEPILETPRKSVFWTVNLSMLIPGLGHAYLGDMKTATALIASSSLTGGFGSYDHLDSDIRSFSLTTCQNVWFYGIYAAYRDVRLWNKNDSYRYKMPTDSFKELCLAPIQPSVLKKPEVWGGFLGAMAVALTTSYLAFPKEAKARISASSMTSHLPFVALPVGIGEEAFFRGYLQPAFSETFTPWGGIILSSLCFGAVHIPNALFLPHEDRWRYYSFSLPLITSLGIYWGWLTHKNNSLKESVAIHTLYDFALFSLSALATKAALPGKTEFAISLPF